MKSSNDTFLDAFGAEGSGNGETFTGISSNPADSAPEMITRREALRRAATLMGGLFFAPTIAGVLNGCTAKPGAWTPTRFTSDQAAFIKSLADTILPTTNTPSATQAGVPSFIETLVDRNLSKEDATRFDETLADFMQQAIKDLGMPFEEAEPEVRSEYVSERLRETKASGDGEEGTPFITQFREMTIVGYFTSEAGATKALRYAPIPGEYRGCIPFEQVGKTWAT